jgi:hypothetical protein
MNDVAEKQVVRFRPPAIAENSKQTQGDQPFLPSSLATSRKEALSSSICNQGRSNATAL